MLNIFGNGLVGGDKERTGSGLRLTTALNGGMHRVTLMLTFSANLTRIPLCDSVKNAAQLCG
jgi:hypothetical protein